MSLDQESERFRQRVASMFGVPSEELWEHHAEFTIEVDPTEMNLVRSAEDTEKRQGDDEW